jgi:hypothetical protein
MCCKWGDLQGKPPSRFLLMDHCFSVLRGLQTGFNEIFELSDHFKAFFYSAHKNVFFQEFPLLILTKIAPSYTNTNFIVVQ